MKARLPFYSWGNFRVPANQMLGIYLGGGQHMSHRAVPIVSTCEDTSFCYLAIFF